jgi:hypothetical protein
MSRTIVNATWRRQERASIFLPTKLFASKVAQALFTS